MGYQAPHETPPTTPIAAHVHYTANAAGEPVAVKANGEEVPVGAGAPDTPVQTTDDTPTNLFVFTTPTNDRAYAIEGLVNVLEESTGESNIYKFVAQFRKSTGGTVTEESFSFLINDEDASLAAATLQSSIAGDDIRIQVVGVVAKTLEWDGQFIEQHRT